MTADIDSGTDSDTQSSDGNEVLDWTDTQNMTENEIGNHLFMLLQQAKRRWRRFTRKPVRRVRRRIRRALAGKGRGKGGRRRLHGRGISAYIQRLSDEHYDDIFFGGKGRGKGSL